MAKKNELKAYIVATVTDYTVVLLAKDEEEALVKASVHYYAECSLDISEVNPEVRELKPYEIYELD